MVRNEEKYQLATYYRKRGFSYSEIAKLCGVSKGTVSNWFAKKAFSKKIKQDNTRRAAQDNVRRIGMLNKARTTERKRQMAETKHAADTEFKHYRQSPLFIAGLMLYFASGDLSSAARIRFSSNVPMQHKIFIKFLNDFAGLTKHEIKCWLLLPHGTNEAEAVTLWSKHIKLPASQFGKTQFVFSGKKRPLHNGTGNTIIGSTVLKTKLLRWIELVFKEVQK